MLYPCSGNCSEGQRLEISEEGAGSSSSEIEQVSRTWKRQYAGATEGEAVLTQEV